jgi:SAM-dependent methyltransferase
MYFVGAPDPDNYLFVGERWASSLLPRLTRGARVLDVGCGSGRVARFLAESPLAIDYVGFDVVPEAIAWCRRFITPQVPASFRFEHIDAVNAAYNPSGKIPSTEVRFPVPDRSVDVAIAASLFTHLLEPDAQHYLMELSRVLVRGGVVLLSLHSATTPALPFNGNEFRVDVFPPYFEALASRAALVQKEDLGAPTGEQMYLYESVRVR